MPDWGGKTQLHFTLIKNSAIMPDLFVRYFHSLWGEKKGLRLKSEPPRTLHTLYNKVLGIQDVLVDARHVMDVMSHCLLIIQLSHTLIPLPSPQSLKQTLD